MSLVSAEEVFRVTLVGMRHLNAFLMRVLRQEASFTVDPEQLLWDDVLGWVGLTSQLVQTCCHWFPVWW